METDNPKSDYLVLFRNTAWYGDLSPEEVQRLMGGWMAWFDALVAEGKCLGGQSLDREGRVIQGADRQITDGPFAEAKESVAGYVILRVDNIEEATEIARQNPGIPHGVIVEVRPLMERCRASQLAEDPGQTAGRQGS